MAQSFNPRLQLGRGQPKFASCRRNGGGVGCAKFSVGRGDLETRLTRAKSFVVGPGTLNMAPTCKPPAIQVPRTLATLWMSQVVTSKTKFALCRLAWWQKHLWHLWHFYLAFLGASDVRLVSSSWGGSHPGCSPSETQKSALDTTSATFWLRYVTTVSQMPSGFPWGKKGHPFFRWVEFQGNPSPKKRGQKGATEQQRCGKCDLR